MDVAAFIFAMFGFIALFQCQELRKRVEELERKLASIQDTEEQN